MWVGIRLSWGWLRFEGERAVVALGGTPTRVQHSPTGGLRQQRPKKGVEFFWGGAGRQAAPSPPDKGDFCNTSSSSSASSASGFFTWPK